MRTPSTWIIPAISTGMSESVRYPCAIVPPKGPAFARSGSTWIHWWSPVASAKRSTCSWVTVCQSDQPRCSPTWDAYSSTLPTLMPIRRLPGSTHRTVGLPAPPWTRPYAAGVAHEEQHRNVTSGGIRAAVFGMSDGVVTNVSLILGFAGAHPAASVVRLAGLAGLFAGAFSMAAGEYLSMSAQRELFEREL